MASPSSSLLANTSSNAVSGLLGSAAQLLNILGINNSSHNSGGEGGQLLVTSLASASAIAVVLALLVHRLSTPRLDPREPPLLKPTIPLVGHIIGLIRNGVDFFVTLQPASASSTGARPPLAIATLPMLSGKSYALWSPTLVQQALRHKNLTFDELSISFAARMFGATKESTDILRSHVGSEDHNLTEQVMAAIKPAMMGQNLLRMNLSALNYVADQLNAVGDGELNVDNVYMWLRELMTMATAEGLYGHQNPLREQPELSHHLWEFEGNLLPLFLGVLPSVIARTATQSREIVQAALIKFYGERRDEADDVAAITKIRAHWSREAGMTNDDLSRLEAALPFVATTNTIPTLFWFFVNIWLRPDLVAKLRAEVAPLVEFIEASPSDHQRKKDTVYKRKAVLDIGRLEHDLPLMVSCYRESIRLANQGVGNRYVMKDAVLTDHDGTQYLLKQGTFAMWASKSLHYSPSIWGADADEFVPDRFVPAAQAAEDGSTRGLSPAQEKQRKLAYIPFGGGRHLCPGRNFAFAENLGFMASLVMGFEVEGLDEGKYQMGTSKMGEAVCKPAPGKQAGPIRLTRRAGWEDVEWGFRC
ncbi:cytochrome P450 [Microdochium trichocladiopsis]|uniref:Cytochrome P450 n=1 Tax=Microdochium trichocladiopsis TaxID=1682393 RepID=A0A9P8XTB0_9PEZI|nr:cytochrome P450 [Microdochium trichocladiopsis]KAH7014196.1 cytochrome P450 [Microdochium trichocladiopsis]